VATTKKAKVKKEPKAKAKDSAGRGRPSQYAGMKIHKLVKENPRREGSAGFNSFAVITSGMSYEKYIEAGGRSSDLNFCIEHGHVEMKK
jgi:hypothetical protein